MEALQPLKTEPLQPQAAGMPADIWELQLPDFWPEDLDPMDNQRVSQWLLGHGAWQGQEPGWKHYALDPAAAAMKPGTWAWRNKRAMDVTLILLGLPIAAPIMALAALALKIAAPREPIFFRQWRPGYLCKPFQILKLRTMRSEGDSESPREDAQRLTRLGRFLRNTSIDELPQLFNVLKGDMSLVGPRPHLVSYLPRYCKEQISRHGTMMGVTGRAQISGRNLLSSSERYQLDLGYGSTRSLPEDFLILLATFPKIGVANNADGSATTTYHEFSGQGHP
ncbi:MAG: sugar transferase [Planctomycetes bacterium]|nr:sugar transferase [Planctomycetota bacterium]